MTNTIMAEEANKQTCHHEPGSCYICASMNAALTSYFAVENRRYRYLMHIDLRGEAPILMAAIVIIGI